MAMSASLTSTPSSFYPKKTARLLVFKDRSISFGTDKHHRWNVALKSNLNDEPLSLSKPTEMYCVGQFDNVQYVHNVSVIYKEIFQSGYLALKTVLPKTQKLLYLYFTSYIGKADVSVHVERILPSNVEHRTSPEQFYFDMTRKKFLIAFSSLNSRCYKFQVEIPDEAQNPLQLTMLIRTYGIVDTGGVVRHNTIILHHYFYFE